MENTTDLNPLVKHAREEVSLLYSDSFVSAYRDNIMRGDGVIALDFGPGNSFRIYTPEGLVYGEVIYNMDLTFSLKMPSEILSRKFVPNSDFMAFEFDAVHPDTDKEFITIFLNKVRMKVKKAEVDYSFYTWKNYVQNQLIELKPNNRLHIYKNGENVLLDDDTHRVYDVTDIEEHVVKLASTSSGCCSHEGEAVEGWVRWRYDDVLLVDFAID